MASKLPTVAIIGRANAGKSSLFNRMVRSQQAIVAREAGTTRDNVIGKVTYRTSKYSDSDVSEPFSRGTTSEVQPKEFLPGAKNSLARNGTEGKTIGTSEASGDNKQYLIKLLHLHLDLFDHYQPQLHRPFETLKRFFKIYIREFDGASELRHTLMQTKSTDEVRAVLSKHSM